MIYTPVGFSWIDGCRGEMKFMLSAEETERYKIKGREWKNSCSIMGIK